MKNETKILIGGAALVQLGSDRRTEDTDYLVNDTTTTDMFIHDRDSNVDYINANGHPFFAAIFTAEAGNSIATPQSLLELKAFSLVQHCLNHNWAKADAAEYDIKFLVRRFGLSAAPIAAKHMTAGQLSEVNKIINSVRV